MFADDIAGRHCKEMASGKFPIYSTFAAIDRAGFRVDDLATLRAEMKELVETLISQEIGAISQVSETIDYVVSLGMPGSQQALAALRSSVRQSLPSRQDVRIILANFRLWLDEAKPAIRAAFLEVLPQLSPSVGDLGTKGMQELLQGANSLPEDGSRCLLELVGRYGSTDARVILGVSTFAHRAITLGRNEYLAELENVAPPTKVRRVKAASDMIDAVGTLTEICLERGEILWFRIMDLIFALSRKSFESASFAAANLPKRVQQFSADGAVLYVQAFHSLVQAMGIRVTGYGLNELPKIFAKYGNERAVSFVNSASLAADTYGVTAGQCFLERKTVASKNALSS